MVVFSSLAAAQEAGFHWHSFSTTHQLHMVEQSRPGSRGLRVKALAFAHPTRKELEGPGVPSEATGKPTGRA